MIKVIHDSLTDTYTEMPLTDQELIERQAAQTRYTAEQTAVRTRED